MADERVRVVITGMGAMTPLGESPEEFWENLSRGVDSIGRFSEEELRNSGVDESLLRDPNYVRCKGVLKNAELFDASFFGYHPIEAQVIDPQHRVFLECAWAALERAGYSPDRYDGPIGVFAGMSRQTYYREVLEKNPEFLKKVS